MRQSFAEVVKAVDLFWSNVKTKMEIKTDFKLQLIRRNERFKLKFKTVKPKCFH